jgi:predicted ester cyclase
MTRLAVAPSSIAIVSLDLCFAKPVLPIAISRTGSSPPRSLPKPPFTAPRQQTAGAKSPNEKQMSPAEMKAPLVLKCMAGFSSGDLSALDGCFHDDYKRNVTPGLKGVSSFAEHVADLRNRHAVLQDARFELEEIIAEGDTVAVRFAMTGVHMGEFLGIPPTGRKSRRAQMAFFHIRDGKIADSYGVSDMYGMMYELNKQQP